MSSIREVAKLAGVSPATVSRVINNSANVDEEKKDRVLRVISETGFVPNEVARSLFKKSAKTIGLILPSIENPFFTQLSSVIEQTADQYGYRIVLCNTGSDFKKERSMMQMLASMNADGIIITTSNEGIKSFIEHSDIPVVITDRQIHKLTKADYVHCDHFEGGKLATRHLMDCGCKNIVCLKGPQELSSARARYEGYQFVCKEHGYEEQAIECLYDYHAGLVATEELLKQYPQVDGIVACNDMVAISVYKVLHKKGIKVPEHIQIIGYDDIALASLMAPELTTIRQPVEDIGKMAAELIVCRRNEKKNEYVFKPQLIQRETTKII